MDIRYSVYSGYIKDRDKLLESSSGGAATAIAESIIRRGGVVFGASYSIDFKRVEYCLVEEISDLIKIKGSKYSESVKRVLVDGEEVSLFDMLEHKLSAGKLVLFIGLGCDVAVVNKYCINKALNTDKLYTLDILCHGPAVRGVHQSYVEILENKFESKLNYFTIRYKKEGWTPFYVKAEFENGKSYEEPFNNSSYGKAFYKYAMPKCTNCMFKGTNHTGDICVGDFWGVTKEMSGYNKDGVSLLVVQTPKGKELLQMIDNNEFIYQKVDFDLAMKGNPMYFYSRKQGDKYEEFIENLKENDIEYAVQRMPKDKITLKKRVANVKYFVRKKVKMILKNECW